MKRMNVAFLVVLMMLTAILPATAFAAEETVMSWSELKAALADTTVDSIVLGADLEVTEKLTVSHPVTIDGNGHSIKRVNAYNGIMLDVNADLDMTDLVIDGQNNWTFDQAGADAALADPAYSSPDCSYVTAEPGAPVNTVRGAHIYVRANMTIDGVTIKNIYSGVSVSIFAVVDNGNLDMTGATIQHVAAEHEAVVLLINSATGTATIGPGTTITDIYGNRNGVVSRINSGTLYMTGGTVSNVNAINSNGSVFMMYQGTLEMSGGTISDNIAYGGPNNDFAGTVYVHKNGKLHMTGGSIINNTGRHTGGVLVRPNAGKVDIEDGLVTGNTAIASGYEEFDDVYVFEAEKIELTGGTYSQEPAEEWIAEGYVAYDNNDGTWTVMLLSEVPTPTPSPTPVAATPTPVAPTATPAPAAPAAPVAPTATPAPAPKTGDSTNLALWMGLIVISGMVLLGLGKKAKAGK